MRTVLGPSETAYDDPRATNESRRALAAGAAVCGPTDLVLVADEQLDTIAATSCVPDAAGHLEADILIMNNRHALTSLELPPALTSLGGHLVIGGSYWPWMRNVALTSLELPPALRSVGGNLEVSNNDVLTSLELPSALSSVGGNLEVSGNGALTSLELPPALSSGAAWAATSWSPSTTR